MRSTSRLRRILAVTACGGLASALASLPAGPAAASVTNTVVGVADATSTFTGTGAFNCNLTSGEDSVSTTSSQFPSGQATKSVSLDATFTSATDPTDVATATGHFTGSLSVAEHRGDLASFSLSGSGSASVTRAKGNASQCATDGFLGLEATTEFTESKPGWLYVTRATGNQAESAIVAFDETNNQTVLFDEFFGAASTSTGRAFLAPSTYNVPELVVGIDGGQQPADRSSTSGGSVSSALTGTFYRTGAALSPTRGAGGRFVRFPGALSCSHHSARLRFTSRADRLTKGTFFVNGHRVVSVSGPRAGHDVVLRHLAPRADIKVTARLSLKAGGRVSATRTYVPCSR